jgi:hypothetical protein
MTGLAVLALLMVRRRFSAVSNHEAPVPIPGYILRDACWRTLLRMRDRAGYDAVKLKQSRVT